MGAEPSRLTRAKPGAPAGSTHSTPPSATPHASPLPPPTRHLAPREGSSRPSSRSGEPPAAGPLSGTTASTCAAPRYSTRAPPPDRACALSPTATAAGTAGMAATVPKAQCRPTESEKPSPETDTSRPPFSGNAAGLAPATRARRTKLTPAPSEEPPTRRVAGPSSDQAASHTASAVDTRCAGAAAEADSQPTEHDACRLLPATWNTVPRPTQPARCATLHTTAASRYWNTTSPAAEPSRLTRAKPGAPAGSTHSTPPSATPHASPLPPPTRHLAPREGSSRPSSRSGEPPAAGPLSGTTASTCAAPRYSTRAPPPDRACALSPTATAAGPACMATAMHSASSRPSTRACTGATVPKAQCRPTESEKPSPETDTSRPPFSGNAAGLAPATRARRTKLTPAPSEEPPTRRAAGPSSDQAASHTASAEDTRCAAAGVVLGGARA